MMKMLLIIAFLVLYIVTSEYGAQRKAVRFCATVALGSSTSGRDLKAEAVAAGAREQATGWLETGTATEVFDATFTGFYPGSDYICRIIEKQGKVENKEPYLITSILSKLSKRR